MSLNLRVSIPAQGTTKVLRFTEQMSVHEAVKTIQEKVSQGGKDHALFQLAPDNDPTSMGRFLKADKTLEFYDLKQNDTVVYRKKSEMLKIKLVDGTIKTFLVDISDPLIEVVDFIANKIGLKNPGEFSIQEDVKGQWLKNALPIPEQVKTLDQVFALKKKFFVNDANVSQDDPIELHLTYCQSRDDIVAGNHPCTKDEAVAFGALQCQFQSGNYSPDVHKPGFLDLKAVLPPVFRDKDNERRLLEEWKKLVGMTDINARFRYVQLCRSLKTYGMTCFKVREKVPNKKKLMDGVVCFTRDTIVRMEYETKRVIKEHSFKHLLRWAASPETFTMDFGAYEEEYIVVVTNEGEAISNLIAGYIDLLLKKQRDTGLVIEEDENDVANVESVARVGAVATTGVTMSGIGGSKIPSYSQGVNDIFAAQAAMDKMKNELFAMEMNPADAGLMSPEQRRGQVAHQAKELSGLSEAFEDLAKAGNKNQLNNAALKMVQLGEQMIVQSRQAAAVSGDPNDLVMVEASKGLVDALKGLMAASLTLANNPNDPAARAAVQRAQQAVQAALQKLIAASKGAVIDDDGYKQLFREVARQINSEANEILGKATKAEAGIPDPTKKMELQKANASLKGANEHMAYLTDSLAAVSKDAQIKNTLERAGKALENAAAATLQSARMGGADPKLAGQMSESQKRLAKALENLLGITNLPDIKGAEHSDDFAQASQAILQSAAALLASEGNPQLMQSQAVVLKNGVAKLGQAGKAIVTSHPDPMARERLANYLKGVVESAKKVLQNAQEAAAAPQDKAKHKKLRDATAEVVEATQSLLADAGRAVAIAALFNSAKVAAAATTQLVTSANIAQANYIPDPNMQNQLNDAAKATSDALDKLLSALKNANVADSGNRATRRMTVNARNRMTISSPSNAAGDVLGSVEQFAPVGLKLVSQAKAASSKVSNPEAKNDLVYASNNTAKAIQNMLDNRKAIKGLKGQLETAEALEEFKAALSDLDAAIISADTGILKGSLSKDAALAEFGNAIKALEGLSGKVINVAKNSPEDLGQVMKEIAAATANLVGASTALAATLSDKSLQKGLLNATKSATNQMKQLIQIARAFNANPDDPNMNALLNDSGKLVNEALAKLLQAASGVAPSQIEDFQRKAGEDIEDLAEKELRGAANVIDKCVMKLNEAMAAARERMNAKGVDIDEQGITEAILESCQAIAKATGILVSAATSVQQDYQKLAKEPATKTVYKRDPQWAQGLISASRTVAGAVTHLVKAANSAAQGNASEELLIVAAQSVSAATTQLVTASTVKTGNMNVASTGRLNDAAKKVTAATSSLVEAARRAAQFEEEQAAVSQTEKFSLHEGKIKEMEQQMAILRLEKELEKARKQLGTMRKDDYKQSTDPEYKPSVPAPNAGRAQPSVPVVNRTPSSGNMQPKVAPGAGLGGSTGSRPGSVAVNGSAPGGPSRPARPPTGPSTGASSPSVGGGGGGGGVNWKTTNNYKR